MYPIEDLRRPGKKLPGSNGDFLLHGPREGIIGDLIGVQGAFERVSSAVTTNIETPCDLAGVPKKHPTFQKGLDKLDRELGFAYSG
jgi:hypothetical protein